MRYFFKKAGVFIKTNWKVISLVGAIVLGYLFFRRREKGFTEQLRQVQEVHRQEIEKIEAARAAERAQHAANEKMLRDALETVQLEYEKAKQELSASKKNEVKKIVKEVGNDPMALAQRLSEATGFRIVLSEDWGK